MFDRKKKGLWWDRALRVNSGWKKIKAKKTRQSLRNATRGPKKKEAADRVEVLLVNERAVA